MNKFKGFLFLGYRSINALKTGEKILNEQFFGSGKILEFSLNF
jgi:hypothetical protein